MAPLLFLLSLSLLSSVANRMAQSPKVDNSVTMTSSFFLCSEERPASSPKPEISDMSFILQVYNCGKAERVPLKRPQNLWNSIFFSHDRPTVIFLMGWQTTMSHSRPQAMAKVFACRNDTNFIVLDTAEALLGSYRISAWNTVTIGRYLAEALVQLPLDYVTKQVHLIGHSLGAQIAGYAGRYFQQLSGSQQLPRLTGLDPARPCFYDGKGLHSLNSEDAQYVQIIHTNPAKLGTERQTGHADFYVEGLKKVKSGCLTNNCSHTRAIDYLVESSYPTNTANFRGRPCQRYEDLHSKTKCQGVEAVMGLAASADGLFYVDVNEKEPYGTSSNWSTFTPANSKCGYCRRHNTPMYRYEYWQFSYQHQTHGRL